MTTDDPRPAAALTMNDAISLVRYAASLEGASAHEAETHEHTAGIRKLARRIQNEATSGTAGSYTVADVALVEGLAQPLGITADRIAAALRERTG